MYPLVDTHCHLDFPHFNFDRETVIKRAREAGLLYLINIGSSLVNSKHSLYLANEYEFIYATVGIHPHEAKEFDSKADEEIRQMLKEPKVVGVGEIGLDYYSREEDLIDKELQKRVFLSLLNLAKSEDKPIVVHNRQAHLDILKILKENTGIRGVIHCFSADEEFLKECLDLGFFISFTCNITYKKASHLRELVKLVPLDRLLLETDAPFLPPQDFRGRRNEPAYVKILAEAIAQIKNLSLREVSIATTDNAIKLFGLK